jgi:hypothetical protein
LAWHFHNTDICYHCHAKPELGVHNWESCNFILSKSQHNCIRPWAGARAQWYRACP